MAYRILVVDDSAALAELFGRALEQELDVEVTVVVAVGDVGSALEQGPFDLALVDLSFPEENASGIDVLAHVNGMHPSTTLAIWTQGDRWTSDILRDAWDLLPVAAGLAKSASLDYQLQTIRALLRGPAPPTDPAIETLLRATSRRAGRSRSDLGRLVVHRGHAKLWRALIEADDAVSYQDIVERTGLKLNTIKNYRAQLLPELRRHCPEEPSLQEMRRFAWRCRALLSPLLDG